MRRLLARARLRTKIIAWSFVPTVIILVAVAAVNLYSYQTVTEDLVIQRDRELTRLLADQLGRDLERYVDNLDLLARLPALNAEALALVSPEVDTQRMLGAFDAGLVLLDPAGMPVSCLPPAQMPGIAPVGQAECVLRARATMRPVFSDILTLEGQSGAMVALAVPVTDYRGRATGVLVGMFRVGASAVSDLYRSMARQIGSNPSSSLTSPVVAAEPDTVLAQLYAIFQGPQFARLLSGTSGAAYIVDSQGRIIYHPDSARIGKLAVGHQVSEVRSGRTGALRTRGLAGGDILASYAPVPGTTWGLISEESWAVLLAPSARYRTFLFALLILGVVLPMGVVTLGVRHVTRPIAQLIEGTARVARGEFGPSIVVDTRDELHDLADQFNLMSLRLQSSYADLERRVAERTAELVTLNTLAIEVGQSLNLEHVLQQALRESGHILGMELGLAYRVDGEQHTLALVARQASATGEPAGGSPPAGAGPPDRLSADDPALSGALTTGTATRLRLAAWPASPLALALQRGGWRCAILIPLSAKQQVIGLLVLVSALERGDEAPESTSLLSSIGHQVGLAMENALLYDQAREVAAAGERQRLARDLHDSVTQSLYGVALYAKAAGRLLESGQVEQARQHIQEVQDSVDQALQQMRVLIFELRPSILDQEGLAGALQSRLEAVETRAGLRAELSVEGPLALAPEAEEALYRIALEALNNALRHAHAHNVLVRLSGGAGRVTLDVRDDGIGFDPRILAEQCGFGWRGMRERAARIGAEISVESAPGKGTCVRVEMAA